MEGTNPSNTTSTNMKHPKQSTNGNGIKTAGISTAHPRESTCPTAKWNGESHSHPHQRRFIATPLRKMKFIGLAACSLLLGGGLGTAKAAPIGTSFAYQGSIYDQGNPMNGNYDFEFQLFGSADGNDPVPGIPPVAFTAVPVANGVFTVNLDFGNTAFAGSARWLATRVRTNAAPSYISLAAREELKPLPYSLFAASAASAQVAATVKPGAVTSTGFAPGAVNSVAIADGSITTADLAPSLLGNTFWLLRGNAGTDPATNFLGTLDNKSLTFVVNKTVGLRLMPSSAGSPSIVGGDAANSLDGGLGGSVISGGGSSARPNRMTGGYYSFIGAGEGNLLRAQQNVIVGGYSNTIGRNFAYPTHNFIGGGQYNLIDNDFSVIGGGSSNENYGHLGAIGGGGFNKVTGELGTIGGGGNNRAAQESVVGGGFGNLANARNATIGGGTNNVVTGLASTVAGGRSNSVSAQSSFIGGGTANAITANADTSVIDGGRNNRIESVNSTIGLAVATSSIISGGERNLISGAPNAAILGGVNNSARGLASAVLAGENNAVDFDHSVVSGNGGVARRSASVTHGAMFAQPGDAQSARYTLTTTTPGNITQLLVGPRLPTGSAFAFTMLISAKAFGDASAGFEVKGLVRNYGTQVALVGSPIVTTLGRDSALALSSVTVGVDSSGALTFRVSSGSSLNVRWIGSLETSEVSF